MKSFKKNTLYSLQRKKENMKGLVLTAEGWHALRCQTKFFPCSGVDISSLGAGGYPVPLQDI